LLLLGYPLGRDWSFADRRTRYRPRICCRFPEDMKARTALQWANARGHRRSAVERHGIYKAWIEIVEDAPGLLIRPLGTEYEVICHPYADLVCCFASRVMQVAIIE